MTDRELMQMALDALEWCYDVTEWPANGDSAQDKAIEALRARLAQPEQEIESDQDHVEDDGCPTEKSVLQRFWREHQMQEPVAWMHIQGNHEEPSWRKLNEDEISRGWTQKPLYTRLEQPQPEPCNWVVDESADGNLTMSWMLALPMAVGTKLYTAPPQREWQGLTDEELNQIYAEPQTHAGQYARAIEAKLKEKNND